MKKIGKTLTCKSYLLGSLVVFFVVLALYCAFLNVPWYYDDFGSIIGKLSVYDIRKSFLGIIEPRGIAFFSFALNYYFGDANVFGYHLVNILIHALNGILVFWLFVEVFKVRFGLSLLGALVFVSHPVQTQSVTYIVQRMTSLSGLFFLLGLWCFVRYEKCVQVKAKWVFYIFSLLALSFSLGTKQNAAVFPVALMFLDYYFLDGHKETLSKKFFCYMPFFLLVGIAYLQTVYFSGSDVFGAGAKAQFFELSRDGILNVNYMPENLNLRYLATQMEVIWIYVRLFFVPVGLTLDYCYPLVDSVFNIKSILGGVGVLSAIYLAWRLRFSRPRITAGLFLFFLLLVVESSVIPLDPIFEHRMYLPIIGLILILADLSERIKWEKQVVAVWVLCIIALSILTIDRNALWASPVAFWEDNISKVQGCFRPYYALGEVHKKAGDLAPAKSALEKAIELNPRSTGVMFSLGSVYSRMENRELARHYMQKSFDLNPTKYNVAFNLGVEYEKIRDYANAEKYQKVAISLEPGYASAHAGLGVALYFQGKKVAALESYRKAVSLAPDDVDALGNYIIICHELGFIEEAGPAMNRLRALDSGLYNRVMAMIGAGGR